MVLLARPGGSFNRAILLRTLDEATVEAELEDDFHHFGVTLHHDGRQALAVQGRSSRYPWTSCPLASGALSALRGLAVGSHPTDLYRHTDARAQCTHQFELAGLALNQAARSDGRRLYEANVEDFGAEGRRASLHRDGILILHWRFSDGVLVAPPDLAGVAITSLDSRSLARLPPEEAEARLVLRRAIWLARGRWIDIDLTPTAADLGLPGACFSYQPANARAGLRRHGSERDFSTGGPPPLAARAEA